jgi:hypothetical protein
VEIGPLSTRADAIAFGDGDLANRNDFRLLLAARRRSRIAARIERFNNGGFPDRIGNDADTLSSLAARIARSTLLTRTFHAETVRMAGQRVIFFFFSTLTL